MGTLLVANTQAPMRLAQMVVAGIVCLGAMTSSASAASLSYPGDCKNSTLERAAKKNGCSLVPGGSHNKVLKSGNVITLIPFSVKANNTCRAIIQVLNSQC
jgi:hypothetical protein